MGKATQFKFSTNKIIIKDIAESKLEWWQIILLTYLVLLFILNILANAK